MAKKITFLLSFIFVVIIASVTAFAAGTESTTPEANFTEDITQIVKKQNELNIYELEEEYGDLFFDTEASSDVQIVDDVTYKRRSSNNTGHTFNGMVHDFNMDDPVIMLMYIKKDGEFVPLEDVESDSNLKVEKFYFQHTVNLPYVGVNKENEVRIIFFRKSDSDRLDLNENIQIVDFKISFRPWDYMVKADHDPFPGYNAGL